MIKKSKQIMITKQTFDEIEQDLVREVTSLTKSLVETLKLRMLLDGHITKEQQEKTSIGLKAFRKKQWNSKLPTEEAYQQYMQSY